MGLQRPSGNVALALLFFGTGLFSYGLWRILRADKILARDRNEFDRLESSSVDPLKYRKSYRNWRQSMLGLQYRLYGPNPVRTVRIEGPVNILVGLAFVLSIDWNGLWQQ